jgi:hypothetical protein
LHFTYGAEPIEIAKEYMYLGVLFSNSCFFRKAAEASKSKGMKALGAMWPLFQRGKVISWEVHRELFDTLVTSTVMYSGHIWGWNYTEILEKVQSNFIRKIFQLDFKSSTYALRLETNSCKLELKLARLTPNFFIRLLNMSEQRIAKMCLSTLSRGDSVNDKRYNWSLNLKDIVTRTGYEYLWTTNDPADIIANKRNILNKLQTQLVQADLGRAAQSNSQQYLTTLQDEQRLFKFFSLGLQNVQIEHKYGSIKQIFTGRKLYMNCSTNANVLSVTPMPRKIFFTFWWNAKSTRNPKLDFSLHFNVAHLLLEPISLNVYLDYPLKKPSKLFCTRS